MGEELVRSERLIAGLLILAACKETPSIPLRRRAAVPQVTATVITIRTTLQPANRTTMNAIVIADDHARATEEIGTWRLFDLKSDRVAFVDDFARTYRYESLKALVERRDDALDQPVSEKLPRVEYRLTGAQQPILGVTGSQAVVKLGAYQREIWFAKHPLIPDHLFPLMEASETLGPEAPIAKRVDEAFLAIRAFPLLDHAELPYANSKIVVDRTVVSVDRHDVAASLLQIPADYTEVKPLPAPVKREKPAPVSVAPPPPAATTTTTTTTSTSTTATTPPPTETTTTTMAPPPPPPAPPAAKPPAKKSPAKKAAPKKKAKAPASHHPGASSHPPGRKTPKGGSRSSGKARKGP